MSEYDLVRIREKFRFQEKQNDAALRFQKAWKRYLDAKRSGRP